MKKKTIKPKDIEGAYNLKIEAGNSIPYKERWVEWRGKTYHCTKIGNEDWTAIEIPELPFVKFKLPEAIIELL